MIWHYIHRQLPFLKKQENRQLLLACATRAISRGASAIGQSDDLNVVQEVVERPSQVFDVVCHFFIRKHFGHKDQTPKQLADAPPPGGAECNARVAHALAMESEEIRIVCYEDTTLAGGEHQLMVIRCRDQA
jgi:hypothetical protein